MPSIAILFSSTNAGSVWNVPDRTSEVPLSERVEAVADRAVPHHRQGIAVSGLLEHIPNAPPGRLNEPGASNVK